MLPRYFPKNLDYKFLCQEKDPLQYQPSKLLDPRETSALDHKLYDKGGALGSR